MIPPHSVIRLRIVCILILTLLAMVPDELLAIQIAPNPNPDGNTITITSFTPTENLVPYTNGGIISIQQSASLSNASRFENFGGVRSGGFIQSAGTITNSDVFINNRLVSLLEGSQFNNLASGLYNGGNGFTGIGGTFVNEGAVEHGGPLGVGQSGQYIQRQAVGSSTTPTTITPDSPFSNAGRVHIAAGDFIINPLISQAASARYDQSSTGTTQVDARFQITGGQVWNAGAITIEATGEYRQQGFPGPMFAGSTSNTGTFTNVGTTNIATGTFTNQGSVANSGTFSVGTTGTYNQTSTSAGVTPTTVNTGTFSNAGMTNINTGVFENSRIFGNTGTVRIGEGATFANTSSGIYHPLPGGTTKIDGNFINNFAVQNGGAITVSTTGSYSQVAGTSFGTGTGNGGSFTNAGQVYIGKDTSFNNSPGASGQSSAGYYVQHASGTTRIDGSFYNRGYVTNEGAMTVGVTGQYVQSRADTTGLPPVSTTNSGTFTNAGTVRIGEGTSFNNFPTLAPGSSSPVGGQYIQQAGGTTQIDGSFLNGGGRLTNEYKITVGATGTFNQTRSSAPVPGTPTTVNIGAFTNAGNTLINAGTFTNQGSLVNSGNFQIGVNGAGTLTNQGTVVNVGTIEVGALGQVAGSGSYLQNAAAAQTIVNGTFAHNVSLQAGTLSGTGTIQGTVQQSGGLLLPGNNGLGTLTIKGQYAQGSGGTLGVNLAGLNSYGLLAVQGTGTAVTLNGNLKVGLLNGFVPSLGNTFGVLTCTGCTINGSLSGLSLPALASGLDWSVGFVNGLGLLQLAVVAGPATSAPEPATLLLVGSGFVGLAAWRRRRAKPHSASIIPS